jgi:hypothetical protein
MGTHRIENWPRAAATMAPDLEKEFAAHAGDGRAGSPPLSTQIAYASGQSGSSVANARLPHLRARLLLDVGHRRPRPWACGQHRGSSDLRSGRDLAAWIGLVPRQNSSGGKERLGGITEAGKGYLRQMLMVGAMAVIRYAQRNSARRPWLVQLMGRRPKKVAAIALANKTARTVWALMSSGERYRDPRAMQATVPTAG